MVTHTRSRLARRTAAIVATALLLVVGYQCVRLVDGFSPWDFLPVQEFDADTFRQAAAAHDDETVADQAIAVEWSATHGMSMAEARGTFGPPRRTASDGRRWIWDLSIPGDFEKAKVTVYFGPDRRLDYVSVHSKRAFDD